MPTSALHQGDGPPHRHRLCPRLEGFGRHSLPARQDIVLIQDNLNVHSKASLYEAFPAAEARRLVERFEWHYTPKHSSWLDLAESELGVLAAQCLDRPRPRQNRPSSTKSRPGSKSAMQITPNQTGTSPPKMLALNSSIYTFNLTESGD